jgi:hypothetical protein
MINYPHDDLSEENVSNATALAMDAVSQELPADSRDVQAHVKLTKMKKGTTAIMAAMKSGDVQQIVQNLRSYQKITNGEKFKMQTGGKCPATGGLDVDADPMEMTQHWAEELAAVAESDKGTCALELIADFNKLAERQWRKMIARGVLANLAKARMPATEPSFFARINLEKQIGTQVAVHDETGTRGEQVSEVSK